MVADFLAETPIRGVVARLDGGEDARKKLGIRGLPSTIILGADGRVAGITYPHCLEQGHIEKVLAGQPADLPAMPARPEKVALGDGPEPLFVAMVRPSKPGDKSPSRGGLGILEQTGTPILYLLARVFATSPCRVQVEGELPKGNFDLIVRLPKSGDRASLMDHTRELAKAALLWVFGLSAGQASRELEALVLQVLPDTEPELEATEDPPRMMMCGGGRYKSNSATASQLAECLEMMLDKPVVNETGLQGRYAFDLTFGPRSEQGPTMEQFEEALAEQAGFALVAGKRDVEVVVVETGGKDDQCPGTGPASEPDQPYP